MVRDSNATDGTAGNRADAFVALGALLLADGGQVRL